MRAWLVTGVFLVSIFHHEDVHVEDRLHQRPLTLLAPLNAHNSGDGQQRSTVTSSAGHWPANYCKITNVYLNSFDHEFVIYTNESNVDVCYGTRDIWNLKSYNNTSHKTTIKCDQTFDIGYVFSIYYHYGSNYFHLHYDTLLPIYSALYHEKNQNLINIKNSVLLPTVEKQRGQGTDWNTEAFLNDSTYWMEMLKVFAGEYKMLPLDSRLIAMKKIICFKEIYFGTPKINLTSKEILSGYSKMIKKNLKIISNKKNITQRPKFGLIQRKSRRKILNENELLESVISFVDIELIDFKQFTFKQQIEMVQNFNVLIGMNGAGLINALYMPSDTVVIQLVPFQAQLNFKEYGQLLKTRGPYLEWHNNYENKSVPVPGDESFSNDNTIVDVNEFVDIIKTALEMLKVQ